MDANSVKKLKKTRFLSDFLDIVFWKKECLFKKMIILSSLMSM